MDQDPKGSILVGRTAQGKEKVTSKSGIVNQMETI